MIARELEGKIRNAALQYPVVLVTGPRQSGKTTLVRTIFENYRYHNLEFPDVRDFARRDPRNFLARIGEGLIIDEVQYVPELLSYIQGLTDASRLIGKVVITGSQNFAMLEKVTQSLAGRVAIFELLPLTYREIESVYSHSGINEAIFLGGYPRLYAQPGLDSIEWLGNYIQTYIERDVRQTINIKDIDRFSVFLQLCAGRTGQLVNYAALGNEAGVDAKTARQWLAVLQSSFIVYTLYPYFENFNKRLVKTSKLYFYDTGLVSYLLQIRRPSDLQNHFARGALFENWIVSEIIKCKAPARQTGPLYFWRDSAGNEIDLLYPSGRHITLMEIKASHTFNSSFFRMKDYWNKLPSRSTADFRVIFAGEETLQTASGQLLSWKDVSVLAKEIFKI